MSATLMREPETIRLLQQIIYRRGEGRGATQTDTYGLPPRPPSPDNESAPFGGYRRRTRKSGKRRRRQTHKRRRHHK